MSAKGRLQRMASTASVYECQPGDQFLSPFGQEMYVQPSLIVPGWAAFAFLFSGSPVAVLVIRPGGASLRYCDAEGTIKEEPVAGDNDLQWLPAAMQRASELIIHNLGERHPTSLAAMEAANKRPA